MARALAGALAALAVVAAVSVWSSQGRDAAVQRAEVARDSAIAAAREAESRRSADSLVFADSIADMRAQRAAEADSAARAIERAEVAAAAAAERTARLRAQLTASQQRELDDLTAYWSEALAEKDRALEQTRLQVTLAEAEAAVERAWRTRETERADSWQAAAAASDALVTELQQPEFSILGVDLGDVPHVAVAAAAGYLLGRAQ